MITADDLFSEDYEENVVELNGDLNEIEAQPTEEEPGDQGDGGDENNEEEARTEVKPKRVIRNPRVKLNENTLRGPRGLSAVASYFDRVKYKGRGFEDKDLNVILKTYEYWCHRLFPKYQFDDCIDRLEKLGEKKGVQTQKKRIRMGIDDVDTPVQIQDDADLNDSDQENALNTQMAQMDVDIFIPSNIAPPEEEEISEEQLELMRQNKERALQLREERLRRLEGNSQLSQDSQEVIPETQLSSTQTSPPPNREEIPSTSQLSSQSSQHIDSNHENDLESMEIGSPSHQGIAGAEVDEGMETIEAILEKINNAEEDGGDDSDD